MIGLAFAIPTLLYATSSPLIFILTKKVKNTGLIFYGYILLVISLLLIGPSNLFGYADNLNSLWAGLSILGFGCALTIIPMLPDMIKAIEDKFPSNEVEGRSEMSLHNFISGSYVAF